MFSTATEFDLNHLLTNDIWPEDQCISPTCLTQNSEKYELRDTSINTA
jgi:hypothetical protein